MKIKRDWIIRMVDIFLKLKLNILYNPTNVREFLRDECDDSISLPTTAELLKRIIYAQEKGMRFKIGNKIRKLEEKTTYSGDIRYELIEFEEK
ncbi:MAG: hypothetical protein ACTSU4_02645 [Promethearchaeota archaeon]